MDKEEKKKRQRLLDRVKPRARSADIQGAKRQAPPSNDLFDKVKIKPEKPQRREVQRQERPEQESGMSDSTFGDIMAGATPLLAGLVSGNMGDAYDVAGDTLLGREQRRYDQKQKLIDRIMKQKESGESPLGKLQAKRLESGEYASFSPITGKYYDPDTMQEIDSPGFYRETPEIAAKKEEARAKASYKYRGTGKSFGTDEKGRIVLEDKVKGEIIPVGNTEGLAPKEKKRIEKSLGKFNQEAKDQIKGLDAAEKFMEAIKIGNPISDQFAIFSLAKTADNGGRLSDQDVNRFGGSKAVKERLEQIKKDAKDGTLTDTNRQYMIEIAESMISTNLNQFKRKAKRFSKQREGILDTDDLYDRLVTSISPRMESPQKEASPKSLDDLSPESIKDLSDEDLDRLIQEASQ